MKIYLKIALIGIWCIVSSMTYAAVDLGSVDLDFCDGSNRLAQYVNTWNVSTGNIYIDGSGNTFVDICMMFTNLSNEAVELDLGIVDGEFAYGAQAVQACKTTANGIFGKGITFSWANGSWAQAAVVSVGPKQKVEKHALFAIPQGFAGNVHGCITYSLSQKKKWAGTINIVDRKANLVDFIIPWKLQSKFGVVPIETVIGSDTVFTSYGKEVVKEEEIKIMHNSADEKMTVFMGLENTGYVDEEYTVKVARSGFFGLIYAESTSSTGALYPQERILYQQSLTGVKRYEWWMKTDVFLEHRPVQQGNELTEEWQKLHYAFSFLLTPVYIVIGVFLLIILVLWKGGAFVHKKIRDRKTTA